MIDGAALDLSSLGNADMSGIVEYAAGACHTIDGRRGVSVLIRHRALHLLRMADRSQIAHEALLVQGFLTRKEFLGGDERFAGGCRALADLLTEAARRSDRGAVASILRGHKHGEQLLKLVAAGTTRRKDLVSELGIAQAQMSRMLRDFDEAGLIIRRMHGRDVEVTLGPAVGELEPLLPWTEVLCRWLEAQAGRPGRPGLKQALRETGAPPDLAARLASSLEQQEQLTAVAEASREWSRSKDRPIRRKPPPRWLLDRSSGQLPRLTGMQL